MQLRLSVLFVLASSAAHLGAATKHHLVFARSGPAYSQLFIAAGDGTGERPLMPATGLDYSPSISRDGQFVVFTSERSGSSDLFRVNTDGSGLEQLTDNAAYDDQASVSPDRSTIAFVSTRADGRAHLFLLDVKSKRVRQLTSGKAGEFRPAWSPDGQWLAFSSDRGTPVQHVPAQWEFLQGLGIYVIKPDGTGLRAVTRGRDVAGSPSWTPDGRRLVFYETTATGVYDMQRGTRSNLAITQVITIDLQSGAKKLLTSGPGVRLWPQMLPDGALAFLDRPQVTQGMLHVVGPGADRKSEAGYLANPSWSADGRVVVYQRLSAAVGVNVAPAPSMQPDFELSRMFNATFPTFQPGSKRLVIANPRDQSLESMNVDGSERRPLFKRDGGTAMSATWSPNGQSLAFSFGRFFRPEDRPATAIYVANADGANLRPVAEDGSSNGFPSWSPDGSRIVYKKDEHLVIVNLADGTLTTLTAPGPQHDNFPQWSPNGEWIAFTSDRATDGDFRIFAIRPDGTGLRQLSDAPGDAHSIWSPDGRFIVFSSARMGFKDERLLSDRIAQPYGELFVMRADGSEVRQLTDNQWEDATPGWAPEP